jgi:prepilin-type N-terminal cleavage/methylation domain-containing protein
MKRRERRGFTLLELIAALLLMGLAMLGGLMLVDQLNDQTSRIGTWARKGARDGNGERLLDRLFRDAIATTDTTRRFEGTEGSISFWTYCETSGGWMAPCHTTLVIDVRTDSSAVLADLPNGESMSLRRQVGSAELRYYDPNSKTDTLWVKKWSSSVTLPGAVGLVLPHDTVVFPIGALRE